MGPHVMARDNFRAELDTVTLPGARRTTLRCELSVSLRGRESFRCPAVTPRCDSRYSPAGLRVSTVEVW
jgi:hypothetical protein